MSPIRYLIITILAFLTFSLLWAGYAWTQIGRYTDTSYGLCNYINRKTAMARAVASPKLVIIAGSNATMGIHVASIDQEFGVNGFNFGLIGYFGPGLQFNIVKRTLKRGDAVLLPLEYLAYDYSTPTNDAIDTVYACGYSYWKALPWSQRAVYVLGLPPGRFWDAWHFRKDRVNLDREAVNRITPIGDIDFKRLAPRSEDDILQVENFKPLSIRFDANSSGPHEISSFINWARANGVTVFATWPNTINFPQYRSYKSFEAIQRFYTSQGIDVIGTPFDSMFPRAVFYNSIYHLTPPALMQRTETLIGNLRENPAFLNWVKRAHAQFKAETPGSTAAPK